jgi:anaphase-promoting complex subunit 2
MYEQTSREFERHKPQRQLTWLPQVGSVEIEVEIGDKTFEFKVQPAYAVVLMKFEEQGK